MAYRLVIISPCRDEARFLEGMIASVARQTQLPDLWLVVDDGSQDRTPEILAQAARRYPWLRYVRRERPGGRQLGPAVVAAFNYGLDQLGDYDYEVLAKLDCDLEFGPETFAAILRHIDDHRVVMASGVVYYRRNGRPVPELYAPYHVPGSTKFYRRECFQAIGGLRPLYGWDILDETMARYHGWRTLSDPRIIIWHHRIQGSGLGLLRGRMVWGWGAYASGSHPLFALARGIFRLAEWPWIIGGLAFLWGFLSAHWRPEIQRLEDAAVIRYLRWEQLYRLRHGNRLPPATGWRNICAARSTSLG